MINDRLERSVGAWLEHLRDLGVEGLRAASKPLAVSSDESRRHEAAGELEEIRKEIGDCTRCKLCKGRTHIVYGVGNPCAELMFVGEAPGRDEDLQGEPFVGRAGQLLTRIIEAIGFKREDVYIANIIKCRPPGNRMPEHDEISTCQEFLFQQIDSIRPKIVVSLGGLSAHTLLDTTTPISRLRGLFRDYRNTLLMPTFHPAYLLRNPSRKREVWEDMQKVRDRLLEIRRSSAPASGPAADGNP
ncbi:MAG: uracil-DNA glycosylase [Acidobacteriota bacterium]